MRRIHNLFLILTAVFSAAPATYSQYSGNVYNLERAAEQFDERGFGQNKSIAVDGNLIVANSNGGLSYSYPISSFTRNSYPITVSLNYAGSVKFTTYKDHFAGQDTPQELVDAYLANEPQGLNGGPWSAWHDSWTRFSINRGAWLVSVNGFAVQAIATTSDMISHYSRFATDKYDYTDGDFTWTIDGLDVSGGLNFFAENEDRDVIRLLRGDGSILELRNYYYKSDPCPNDTVSLGDPYKKACLWTGDYYPEEPNPTGYGRVEIDAYAFSELRSRNPNVGGTDVGLAPRKVFWYPGDGLEYVFYEEKEAWGAERYRGPMKNGNMKSGGSIFYLRELNGPTGNLLELRYSRHTVEDVFPTAGRALLTGFYGHHFSWSNGGLKIEALGRSYRIFYRGYGSGQGAIAEGSFPIAAHGRYGVFDGGNADSYLGLVTSIRDPEGRVTAFDYESYTRVYENFNFPVPPPSALQDVRMTLVNRRMSEVEAPTFKQAISYYGTGSITIRNNDPEITTPGYRVDTTLNNVVQRVDKQDYDDNLLTRADYSFVNSVNSHVFSEKLTDYRGGSAPGVVEREYSYNHKFYSRYRPNYFNGSWVEDGAYYTALELTREVAGDRTSYTTTAYGTPAGLYTYYWLPTGSTGKVESGGQQYYTQRLDYSYDLVSGVRDYGGIADLQNKFGKDITRITTIEKRPDNAAQSLLTHQRDFQHLPTAIQTLSWTYRNWDKIAAIQTWLALEDDPNEDNPYESYFDIDTFTTVTELQQVRTPYWRALETTTQTLDASGNILSGTRRVFATSFFQDNQEAYVPGALLSDSLVGEGGATLPGASYRYSALPERKNSLQEVVNALGSRRRYWYDHALVPGSGHRGITLYNDDSSDSSLHKRKQEALEAQVAETDYVRRVTSGSISEFDDLTTAFERSYFDLVSGSIEPNGYYARFDYDNNGRLRRLWLPGDFGEDEASYTFEGIREHRMYGRTRYKYTRDTVFCWFNPDTTKHAGWPTGHDEIRSGLSAGLPTTVVPECIFDWPTQATLKVQRRDAVQAANYHEYPYEKNREYIGLCSYVAQADDPFQSSERVDSAWLELDVTGVDGECVLMDVAAIKRHGFYPNIWDGDTLLTKRYLFRCPDGTQSQTTTHSVSLDGEPLRLRVDFPQGMISTLLGLDEGTKVDFECLVYSYGGVVEFATDADDSAPRIKVAGRFTEEYLLSDYSLSYDYVDGPWPETHISAKVDDSLHSYNDVGAAPEPDDNYRRTEVSHYFGPDYRILRSEVAIGDPANPARIDSVGFSYSGLGLLRATTDQELYADTTHYDSSGRPLELVAADGSRRYLSYAFGDPATFGIDELQQDMYGLAFATFNTDEEGVVSASYSDAYGRLRREVLDTGGLKLTTSYDYDLLGRLTLVVNPAGDSTTYDYDAFGRVRYKSQPDLGTVSYAYDKLGQTRFSQTQDQSDSGLVAFYEYDDLGRVTVIGEADLSAADTSGSGGGEPIAGKVPGGDLIQSGGVTLNRMTDILDPNQINNGEATANILTVNTTLWDPLIGTVPAMWQTLDSTECLPTVPSSYLTNNTLPVGPYLRHGVHFYEPLSGGLTAETYNFEHLSAFPEHVRTVINYDGLPARQGVAWRDFPPHEEWHALAPAGRVRNQKGREAAVAYRQHSGQPFHYVVMSYDARGRLEALLRYTENIGFDALYWEYNAQNAVIAVRSVDAFRQHQTWYGYDHNGRLDTVWTELGGVGSGYSVGSPAHPAPLVRPVSPEILYEYTKRGQLEAMEYPAIQMQVDYFYNARRLLDSMIAWRPGFLAPDFHQALVYEDNGQILRQTARHGLLTTPYIHDYSYDNARRLVQWGLTTTSSTARFYSYDNVGNRLTLTGSGPAETYNYNDPAGPNRLSGRSAGNQVCSNSYNPNGALKLRQRSTCVGIFCVQQEEERYAYDMSGNLTGYFREDQTSPSPWYFEDWRYRHSPSGEREQKRLYDSRVLDDQEAHLWTYYLLAGSRQMAVYYGLQANDGSCESSRYVWLYPTEYVTYGVGDVHNIAISPDPLVGKRYKIADHLGNTRLVIDENGIVFSDLEYEPFGATLIDFGAQTQFPPRKTFIDKEKDAESGLGDFSARKYDEGIGRFTSIDPLWERFPKQSPYVYSENNPLSLIDPSGEGAIPAPIPGPIPLPLPLPPLPGSNPFNSVEPNPGLELYKALKKLSDWVMEQVGDQGDSGSDGTGEGASDDDDDFESAAQQVPDLSGKSREDAMEELKDSGFVPGRVTEGDWEKWTHEDGSVVWIGPNGRIVRTAPRRWNADRTKKFAPRVSPHGEILPQHAPHNTGENLDLK